MPWRLLFLAVGIVVDAVVIDSVDVVVVAVVVAAAAATAASSAVRILVFLVIWRPPR